MLFYLKNTELHYVKTAIFEIAHKCLSSVATNALNLTKKSLDKAREKIFLKFKPRMICNQLQIIRVFLSIFYYKRLSVNSWSTDLADAAFCKIAVDYGQIIKD